MEQAHLLQMLRLTQRTLHQPILIIIGISLNRKNKTNPERVQKLAWGKEVISHFKFHPTRQGLFIPGN